MRDFVNGIQEEKKNIYGEEQSSAYLLTRRMRQAGRREVNRKGRQDKTPGFGSLSTR